MFSSRVPWDLHPNRLAAALQARRAAGAPILDLTESNPTRATLDYPSEEILDAFRDPRALVYDPLPAGSPAGREAVAGYYRQRGHQVAADRILLTASTSESYGYLFKLLADPGDEILVPRPSYPLFEFLATMESLRVVQYPLIHDGRWSLDLDGLDRAVTGRTRAIVLVNPNNPTGSFLKRSEWAGLADICRRRSLAIISDEVFADYGFAPDPERVETLAGVEDTLAFALSGLSKVSALPQMKLGWMVIAGPPPLRARAAARLELIADTYLSVSTPVQLAAPRLLRAGAALRDQIARRAAGNLQALRAAIGPHSSCQVLDVEGGWYATLRAPRTHSEEEWCLELLERDGVLVQPGFFYDFESEAFLVLSLLTPAGVFQEGIARILARIG